MNINDHLNAQTVGELTIVCRHLNNLIQNHNFEQIDAILNDIDTEQASIELLICLARYTFSYKQWLQNWQHYVELIEEQTQKRNIDKEVLQGLI